MTDEIEREDRVAAMRARLAGKHDLADEIEIDAMRDARDRAVRECEHSVSRGAAGDGDGGLGSPGAGAPEFGNAPLIDLAARARADWDDGDPFSFDR